LIGKLTTPLSRISLLVACQALLCWLETWLILKISFIGKIRIATVHKEYGMLRSGWKTFLLLFSIQLVIIITLSVIEKRLPKRISVIVTSVLLLLGVIGLFITFQDFLYTYTHRLLKERFHTGFYLFWVGWVATCLFFVIRLTRKRSAATFPLDPNTPDNLREPSL